MVRSGFPEQKTVGVLVLMDQSSVVDLFDIYVYSIYMYILSLYYPYMICTLRCMVFFNTFPTGAVGF